MSSHYHFVLVMKAIKLTQENVFYWNDLVNRGAAFAPSSLMVSSSGPNGLDSIAICKVDV